MAKKWIQTVTISKQDYKDLLFLANFVHNLKDIASLQLSPQTIKMADEARNINPIKHSSFPINNS